MILCLLKDGSKSFVVSLLQPGGKPGGKPWSPLNFCSDKDYLGTGHVSLANKVDESAHLAIVMLLNLFGSFHAVAVKADREDPVVKEKEFGTAYVLLMMNFY